MRLATPVAAIAALLATTAGPAQAQGFLKRLAERAIQKVEQKAEQAAQDLDGVVESAAGGGGGSASARRGSASGGRASAPEVMTPRAVRGGAPRAAVPGAPDAKASSAAAAGSAGTPKFPSRMSPPAGFEAVKTAYDTFGKVRCMSCEGGYGHDGWPRFPRDELSGKYNETGMRLGAMSIGDIHQWKGAESAGTLTIVAEEIVGGFRCRKLQYRLVKGTASAERPGLVCWGYANAYAASEGWNEVY
jgi:hypothetical protein